VAKRHEIKLASIAVGLKFEALLHGEIRFLLRIFQPEQPARHPGREVRG
jgi:hypothetical protein